MTGAPLDQTARLSDAVAGSSHLLGVLQTPPTLGHSGGMLDVNTRADDASSNISCSRMLAVDIASPSPLTVLERVQNAVQAELTLDGLCVELQDSRGTRVGSNVDLCRALGSRTPLRVVPSDAAVQRIDKSADELQELRAKIFGERFASLEKRVDSMVMEVAHERGLREALSARVQEMLDGVSSHAWKASCHDAPQSAAKPGADVQSEIAECLESRAGAFAAQDQSFRDRYEVQHAHLCNVSQETAELSKQLKQRMERLELEIVAQSKDVTTMGAQCTDDAAKLERQQATLEAQEGKISELDERLRLQGERLSAAIYGALQRFGESEASVFAAVVERLGSLAERLPAVLDGHIQPSVDASASSGVSTSISNGKMSAAAASASVAMQPLDDTLPVEALCTTQSVARIFSGAQASEVCFAVEEAASAEPGLPGVAAVSTAAPGSIPIPAVAVSSANGVAAQSSTGGSLSSTSATPLSWRQRENAEDASVGRTSSPIPARQNPKVVRLHGVSDRPASGLPKEDGRCFRIVGKAKSIARPSASDQSWFGGGGAVSKIGGSPPTVIHRPVARLSRSNSAPGGPAGSFSAPLGATIQPTVNFRHRAANPLQVGISGMVSERSSSAATAASASSSDVTVSLSHVPRRTVSPTPKLTTVAANSSVGPSVSYAPAPGRGGSSPSRGSSMTLRPAHGSISRAGSLSVALP